MISRKRVAVWSPTILFLLGLVSSSSGVDPVVIGLLPVIQVGVLIATISMRDAPPEGMDIEKEVLWWTPLVLLVAFWLPTFVSSSPGGLESVAAIGLFLLQIPVLIVRAILWAKDTTKRIDDLDASDA